jgi:hypothetical protein
MLKTVECPNCFHKVRVDPRLSRTQVMCLKCGQSISIAEEDQESSYALGVQPCPRCGKDFPLDAALCIECGYDFKTRKQHRTRYEPFHATWSSVLSFGTRLLLFGVLELLCLAAFWFGWRIGFIALGLATVGGGLLLGSSRVITLSRSPEGKAMLRVRRWAFFYPWVNRTFNLKHYRNVALHYKGSAEDDRGGVLGLFNDYDEVAEYFTLKIIRIDGQSDTIISSSDEDEVREIGDAICKVGGLHYG